MIKETKKSLFNIMFQSLTVLNDFSVLKNTVYKCYNQILENNCNRLFNFSSYGEKNV